MGQVWVQVEPRLKSSPDCRLGLVIRQSCVVHMGERPFLLSWKACRKKRRGLTSYLFRLRELRKQRGAGDGAMEQTVLLAKADWWVGGGGEFACKW